MKKTARSARVVATAAVGVLALTGCSAGTDSSSKGSSKGGGLPEVASPQEVIAKTTAALDGKKVRMVLLSDANALQQSWASWAQGMFAGTGIDFSYSVSNYDNQVLAQQVQTVIDQKADALILQNADVSGLAKLVQKAQAAGIYVAILNLGSNAQSDAFVGPNWDQMAADLADRASEDCKAAGGSKVAIVTGFGADTGSVLFKEGATRAFEKNGMKIVATQPGQYDPSKAGDVARTILQQHPDLCAFAGNWDGMMLGVSKVVKDAGKAGKVGVYTTDSSLDACAAIGDGILTAAVNYGGGDQIGISAAAIIKYLLQSGVPAGSSRTAVFTGTTIIDKSNYQDPGACYGTPAGWKS